MPRSPEHLFAFVDDLASYSAWMSLVHEAVAEPAAPSDPAGSPVWMVELRAQMGPLARSKRLRMLRTMYDPPHRVTFERAEVDGRSHAPWTLDVELTAHPDGPAGNPSTTLVMTLTYGGRLWTGAVLQRVLDEEVARGSEALIELATADRTH